MLLLPIEPSQDRQRAPRESRQISSINSAWRSGPQLLDDFAQMSTDYFWEMDADLRYCYLSDRFTEVTGVPKQLALGSNDRELGVSNVSCSGQLQYLSALQGEQSFRDAHYAIEHPGGHTAVVSVTAHPMFDRDGNFAGYRGTGGELHISHDNRHAAGNAKALYQLAGRIKNLGFWEWDEVTDQCTFCSEEYARIHGMTVSECLQTPRSDGESDHHYCTFPDDIQRYDRAVAKFRGDHKGFEIEYRLVRPDGSIAEVCEAVAPIVDRHNRLVGSFGFLKDITTQSQAAASIVRARDELDARVQERTRELRRMNEALLESQIRLRDATRIAKLGYFRWDIVAQRGIFRDEELAEIHGASVTDIDSETTADFLTRVHPEDVKSVVAHYDTARFDATPIDIEYRIVRPDGDVRYVHERSTPVLAEDGSVRETFGTVQDITERRAIANELAQVEERLYELGANAREVLYILTADWREVIYVSNAFEEVWGQTCEALIENPRLWIDSLHPDDQEMIFAELERKMSSEDPTPDFSDARIIGADGKVRWLSARVYPIRDGNNRIVRFAGVAEDVTDRKTAAEVLHHAQKMDALGQLTGGVAHDFNNLLAVILGNTELLAMGRTPDDSAMLADIFSAGQRGADLTKRLLAFSRLQPLRPESIDVGKLVNNLGDFLRRTLGATIDVDISTGGSSTCALVDPGLLENALLNVSLNSRDAMPSGGTLRIRVSSPHKRSDVDCVGVTVQDDGVGMKPADLSRALEPFFTTKNIGDGRGLGLPMVYGFVKQSNGDLVIDSKFGGGTTVSIFLPCADENRPNINNEPGNL